MAAMEISFIESTRDGKLIVHNSFLFRINNKYKKKTYWKCTEQGCSANLILNDSVLERTTGNHVHEPPSSEIIRRKFYNNLKKRCKEDKAMSAHRIYSTSKMAALSFIESERGTRLLLLESYLHTLNRVKNHKSYWICATFRPPRCRATVILKDNQLDKKNGVHSHPPPEDTLKRKRFYARCKARCRNEKTSIRNIYKQELAKELAASPESASYLPSLKTAERSLYNVRGNKSASSHKTDTKILVVLDQSLYKMEFVDSLKGGRILILDGHIFQHQRSYVSSTYWACSNSKRGCHATATLTRTSNRLMRVGGTHNHDPPEAQVRHKKFLQKLKVRITEDPSQSLCKIYREELEKFATTPERKLLLPSEKKATGIMQRMKEQVLNAANSTDSTMRSDSNLDNAVVSIENSTSQGPAPASTKTKKVIPKVCLTINVKRELAQADPYDPSLSPCPPDPPSATSTNPPSSTFATLGAMICEQFPANNSSAQYSNYENEPDPELARQAPLSNSSSGLGLSSADTIHLDDMTCESLLRAPITNLPSSIFAPLKSTRSSENDIYETSLHHKNNRNLRFVSLGPFSLSSSCPSPSKATTVPVEACERFLANNSSTPSLYHQSRITEMVYPGSLSLPNSYQSAGMVSLEPMPSEKFPAKNYNAQSTTHQNKPEVSHPETLSLSSSCTSPSNTATIPMEVMTRERLASTQSTDTYSSPIIFSEATIFGCTPSCNRTIPPCYTIAPSLSKAKRCEQFPANDSNAPSSNDQNKPEPKRTTLSLLSSDSGPSNLSIRLEENSCKHYTSDKAGAISLICENKLKPRIGHPHDPSLLSTNLGSTRVSKVPFTPNNSQRYTEMPRRPFVPIRCQRYTASKVVAPTYCQRYTARSNIPFSSIRSQLFSANNAFSNSQRYAAKKGGGTKETLLENPFPDNTLNEQPAFSQSEHSNLEDSTLLSSEATNQEAGLPTEKVKEVKSGITIIEKKDLSPAEPYDTGLSNSPNLSSSSPDPFSSSSPPLEPIPCDRFPPNKVHTPSLNFQNKPNERNAFMVQHSVSSSCQGPSNSISHPSEFTTPIRFPPDVPYLYNHINNFTGMVHPGLTPQSNFNPYYSSVPIQGMNDDRFSVKEVSLPCIRYQCTPGSKIAQLPSSSLSSFYPGPSSATTASSSFMTYKRFPSDKFDTPNFNVRNTPRATSAYPYRPRHSSCYPPPSNDALKAMKTESSSAVIVPLETVTTGPTSDETVPLEATPTYCSNVSMTPSDVVATNFSSVDIVALDSMTTAQSNEADVPLKNMTKDLSSAVVVPLEATTTNSSNTDTVPKGEIPCERYKTDKVGAQSLNNRKRLDPQDALKSLFAFKNNYFWNYSPEPKYQFESRNTLCVADTPFRPPNDCDPCLQNYCHESSNPSTDNPSFQPLNVSDSCLQNNPHESPNAEVANPLFQPPVLIKDEVVYSEDEEL